MPAKTFGSANANRPPIGIVIDEPEPASGGDSSGDTKPQSGIGEPEARSKRSSGNVDIPIADPIGFEQSPSDDTLIGYELPGTDRSGTSGRRRGRPPGSRNRTTEAGTESKKASINLDGLEALLLSVHTMGAQFSGFKELELSKDEARNLAEAYKNVAKFYDTFISPKQAAITQLVVVCLTIYGARLAVFLREYRKPKAVPPVSQPGPVPVVNVKPAAPKPDGIKTNIPIRTPAELFGTNDGPLGDNAFV